MKLRTYYQTWIEEHDDTFGGTAVYSGFQPSSKDRAGWFLYLWPEGEAEAQLHGREGLEDPTGQRVYHRSHGEANMILRLTGSDWPYDAEVPDLDSLDRDTAVAALKRLAERYGEVVEEAVKAVCAAGACAPTER